MKKSELEIGLRYVNRERDKEIARLREVNRDLVKALEAIAVEIPHRDGKLWAFRVQGWAKAALAKAKGEA